MHSLGKIQILYNVKSDEACSYHTALTGELCDSVHKRNA
jgi:hypothetical protein